MRSFTEGVDAPGNEGDGANAVASDWSSQRSFNAYVAIFYLSNNHISVVTREHS